MRIRKIAILIIAHKNEKQTHRLINYLKNDFDLFVHIDKRAKFNIAQSNNVNIYKKYKPNWGSFVFILTILFLLKQAYEKKYDRYILISAQDLPLKTNAEIRNFLLNNENEYISIIKIPTSAGWPNMSRLTRYHINGGLFFYFFKFLFYFIEKIKPRKLEYDFYGGSVWFNFTNNCVQKIIEYLDKNPEYIKRYHWTSCCDEIFFQTILYQLEGIKIVNDNLRYIEWEDGKANPKILTVEYFNKLICSNALFARKFDELLDCQISDKIYEYLHE